MGFFSKIFKKVKPFALPAIGALIAGPAGLGLTSSAVGAALGSGISSYTSQHDPLAALLSAGGSLVGSSIGSSLLPQTVGSAAFSNLPGGALSNFAQNSIPSALANASIGSLIGSNIGSSAGASFAGNSMKEKPQIAAPAGPKPFVPKQDAEQDLPPSLAGFGALSPMQRSTNLANQGVYGGGNGPEEQAYYVNQAQRRLVDPAGKVADQSIFNPIEQSYLQRLGLGGASSGMNLAELISKWKPA